MTPLRMSHSNGLACFAVGEHRRGHVLGRLGEEADDLVDHVVAEVGALRARDGETFGQISARQRGDVVSAEHARPASGQHHESGERVDQQLAPRRGDEVGVELDGDAGAAQQLGERVARRRDSGSTSRTRCAAAPSPRAVVSAENHTTAGTTVDDGQNRPTRSTCSTPFCSAHTTVRSSHSRASQPDALWFWVSLTASSTTSTGPSTSAGSVRTGPGTTIGSPSSGLTST